MKAVDLTRQQVIADKLDVADTFWSRMKGLLGREALLPGQGLLITRCNSIHMFFMRFPIDAIFLNRSHQVVGLVSRIPPFALSAVFWSSTQVIEVPAGTIDRISVRVGDQIQLTH